MAKIHPTVKDLLTEIEAYRARSGITRTAFGQKAVNNGNIIPRLESGRTPTIGTIERIRAFIHSNSKAVRARR